MGNKNGAKFKGKTYQERLGELNIQPHGKKIKGVVSKPVTT